MAIDYAAQKEALEKALLAGELTVESDGDRVTYRSVGEIRRALDYCDRMLNTGSSTPQRPASTLASYETR